MLYTMQIDTGHKGLMPCVSAHQPHLGYATCAGCVQGGETGLAMEDRGTDAGLRRLDWLFRHGTPFKTPFKLNLNGVPWRNT